MDRCKTCKHWVPPETEYGEVPGTGRCKKVPQYWSVTEWDEEYEHRILKQKYIGVTAFVQDGSDYSAILKTLPDFGCVMHEAPNAKVSGASDDQ